MVFATIITTIMPIIQMTEENVKHINYMQPIEAVTPRKPLPITGWRNGDVYKATCKDNKTGVKIAKQS